MTLTDETLDMLRDLLPGTPDTKLRLVALVVSHGLGKRGGRPRKEGVGEMEKGVLPNDKPVTQISKPVCELAKGVISPESVPSDLSLRSDPDLGSESDPDLQEQSGSGSVSESDLPEEDYLYGANELQGGDPQLELERAPVRKVQKRTTGDFDTVLGHFGAAWAAGYGGERYLPTPADKSQLGRLLRTFESKATIEAFPWRVVFENYVADKSRWAAEEHRHSLAQFCMGGVNKYRVKAGTEGYSAKEIRGRTAVQAFAAMGKP